MPDRAQFSVSACLRFILIFFFFLQFSVGAYAADIQAVLDSSDGSSGMVVQDSANAARVRMLSNGNVGINTVTPAGTLELIKSGTNTPVMVSSSASSHGDYLSIASDGNIGIGTVGPTSKFLVSTGADENLRVRPGTDLSATNGMAIQSVSDSGSILKQLTLRSSDLLVPLTGNVGIGTTTPQGGLVSLAGNVGIGTWAPQSGLEVRNGMVRVGSGTVDHVSATGDVYISGGLEVDGNVWLGDAITDDLVVTGRFTQSGVTDFSSLEVRNSLMVGTEGGNIGIGTNAASASLEVAKQSSDPLLMLSSTGTANGDYMTVNSSGNVGIGTTTPQGGLVSLAGNVGIGTWAPQSGLEVRNGLVRIGSGTVSNVSAPGDLYVSGGLEVDGSVWLGDAVSDNLTVTGTFTQSGDFNASGNFGVGTTTPQTKLAVLGPVGIGTWTTPSAGTSVAIMNGNLGVGLTNATEALQVNGTVLSTAYSTTGGYTQSGTTANTLTGNTAFTAAGTSATFSSNVGIGTTTPQGAFTSVAGNVGIGTWAPQSGFEVRNGLARFGSGTVSNVSAPGDVYISGGLEVDGNVWLGDATSDNLTVTGTFSQSGDFNVSGNFGVGTTTPQTKLSVLGPVGIGTWTAPSDGTAAAIVGGNVGIGTVNPAGLLTVSGNVGIGTWTPSAQLAVGANAFTVDNAGAITASTGMANSGSYTQSGTSANTFTGNSSFTAAGTSAIFNANVGMGTTTPQTGLAIINGNVGIGTWAAQSALEVRSGLARFGSGTVSNVSAPGDVYISGGLEVDGSVWLGDATSDNLTVTGTFTQSGDFNASGNFGVGTTTPQTKLAVLGAVGIGTWTAPSAGTAVALMNGNLGIGNISAETKLHVSSGDVLLTNNQSYRMEDTSGNNVYVAGIDSTDYIQLGSTTNTNGIKIFSGSTVESVRVDSVGRVGIGTTTPQGGLVTTSGNVGIGTWAPQSGFEVRSGLARFGSGTVSNVSAPGDVYISGGLEVDGSVWLGDAVSDNLTVTGTFSQSGDFNVSGNFGIGTTTPQTSLAVLGNIGIGTWTAGSQLAVGTGFTVNNAGAITATTGITTSGGYTQSGTTANTITGTTTFSNATNAALFTGGNIGVGTTTPAGLLTVSGNVGIGTWTPTAQLAVGANAFTVNNAGAITASTGIATSGGYTQSGTTANTITGTTTFSNATNAALFTGGNIGVGTTTPAGLLTVSGNVGIGTWAPDAMLDVRGGLARIGSGTNSNATGPGDLYVGGNLEVDGSVWLGDAAADNLTVVGSFNQTGDQTVSGNFGVGTTTPQNKFSVLGPVGIGTWTTPSAGAAMAVMNGNVGIGSFAPGKALDVAGDIRATGGGIFYGNGSGLSGVSAVSAGGDNAVQYNSGSQVTGGSEAVFSFNGTNVGIGTVNGRALLDVRGTTSVIGNIGVGTSTPQTSMVILGNVGVGTWTAGSQFVVGNNAFAVSNAGAITASTGMANSGSYTQSGTSANTFTGTSTFSNATTSALFTGGNVGIGTTTPQGKLVVSDGNIGIGTWAPIQPLHVNGQCVTGDTRLRRRRRRADGSYDYDEVRIDQIQPGDEILSLNEHTGELEYQEVEALMDMGIKPIFKLTTASGKTIRTTGNHPYLVLPINTNGLGKDIQRPKGKNRLQKIFSVFGADGAVVLKTTASKHLKDQRKRPLLSRLPLFASFFVEKVDAAKNQGYTQYSNADSYWQGQLLEEVTGNASGKDIFANVTHELGSIVPSVAAQQDNHKGSFSFCGEVNVGEAAAGKNFLTQCLPFVNGGQWRKVSELSVGQMIATVGDKNNPIFEQIVSIEQLPPEQVWDIQIANTRNFVGNDIIAHNTYINGNLGIGASAPAVGLQVGSGAGITSVSTADDAYIKGNLEVDGSVWLGDAAADNLTIVGSLNQTGDINTTANLGVGTTTPQTTLAVLGNIGVGTWTAGSQFVVGNNALTINNAGAITASTGMANSGSYTQSGTSANTFTGTSTFNNATTSALFTGGNVGVGTTTPQGAFVVTNGNVGIGTWTPRGLLDVHGALNVGGDSGNVSLIQRSVAASGSQGIAVSAGSGYAESSNFTVTDANRGSFIKLGGGAMGDTFSGYLQLSAYGNGSSIDSNAIYFTRRSAADTTTESMRISNTGNIGIGTTTPQGGLTVGSGNVGIGTWAPAAMLDVRGGAVRIGAGTNSNATGVGDLYVGGNLEVDGSVWLGDAAADNLTIVGTLTQSGTLNQQGDLTVNGGNFGVGTTTPQASIAVASGNVGIGTWTAAQALDVVGSIAATGAIAATGNITGANMTGSANPSASIGLAAANGTATTFMRSDATPALSQAIAPTWTGIHTFSNATNSALFTGGNVGIGTTTPQTSFAVAAGNVGIGTWTATGALDVRGGNVRIGAGTNSNATGAGDLYVGGNLEVDGSVWLGDAAADNLTVVGSFNQTGDINTTANMGIGTTTPQTSLAVQGQVGIGTWTTPGAGTGLGVVGGAAIGTSAYVNATAPSNGLIVAGNVGVGTTTPQGAFVVTNGNVGIGTWAPNAALDIKGTMNLTGSAISTTSGDLGLNPFTGRITIGNKIATSTGGAVLRLDNSSTLGWSSLINNTADGFDDTGLSRGAAGFVFVGNGTNGNTSGTLIASNIGLGTTTPQTAFAIASGNVGIGTWTTTQRLDVNGTVKATAFIGDGAGISGVTAVPAGGLNAIQYTDGSVTLGDESKLSFDGTNVGIGTSNGYAKLDLRGVASVIGNVGVGTSTPQGALTVTNGNVGIGTWAPTAVLDVRSGLARIGAGTNTNATGAGDLYVGGNLEVDGSVWLGDAAADNLTIVGSFNQTGNINTTANIGVGTTTPQASIAVASGNVGIGTWTAAQALDVVGSIAATGAIAATGNITGANMTGSANPSASIGMSANNGAATTFMRSDATPAISAAIAPTWTGIHTFSNATNSALFTGGNVGIGTTTPQTAFAVAAGNVGIGTWTATGALDVRGGNVRIGAGTNSNATAAGDLYVGGNLEVDGSVWLGDAAADNLTIVGSFNQTGNINTTANIGVGTTTPQASIAVASGNVGIGTWTAAQALDVVGNIAATGTIAATGNITGANMTGSANPSASIGLAAANGTATTFMRSDATPALSQAIAPTWTGIHTFSNATNSALFTGGNVGIGTTTPQGGLTVGSGNVGIGTWSPAAMLDVRGGAARIGAGTNSNATGVGDLYVGGNLEVDGSVWLGDAAADNLTIVGSLNQTGDINTTANLGVGTTTPQTTLAVLGNIGIGTWTANSQFVVGNNALTINNAGAITASTGMANSGSYTQSGTSANTMTGTTTFSNATTSALFTGGNVGVGTTTPQGAFVVTNGNVGIGTWAPAGALAVMNGNVGFGISAPAEKLHLAGNDDIDIEVDTASDGNNDWSSLHLRGSNGTITSPTASVNGDTFGGISGWGYDGSNYRGAATIYFQADGAISGGGAADMPSRITFLTTPDGSATSVERLRINSSGNVGIGTTNPQAGLAVTNGNVGIGTWTASSALDVNGTVTMTGFKLTTSPTNGYVMTSDANGNGTWQASSGTISGLTAGYISKASAATSINDSGLFQAGNNIGLGTTTPQTLLAITTGNVGIGTWTAAQALDVNGSIAATGAIAATGNITGANMTGSANPSASIGLAAANGTATTFMRSDATPALSQAIAPTWTGIHTFSNATNSALFTGGNVGIGTTTPQTAFAVAAGNVGIGTWVASGALDVRGGNVRIGAGTNTNATGAGDLYVGGSLEVDGSVWLGDAAADNLTVVGSFNQTGNINTTANIGVGTTTPQASIAVASGNVGIGTWTAAQALDVVGSIAATGAIAATGNITGANMTGSANPSASIGMSANNGAATTFMRSDATPAISAAIAPTWTGIHTFSNATNSALFTGGNVGIGTTTPQTAFAVAAGNVGIGTWTATGALDVRGGNVRIGAGTNTNATGAGDLYVGGNLEVDGSVWLGDAAADNLTVVGSFNQTGDINTTANVGVGTTTPQASIAVASGNVGIGTWTAAQALDVNGNIIATGTITATGNLSGANMTGSANPSASIGMSANNGAATTFMRSDATPAISAAIAPTWTGIHTFSNATNSALFTGGNVGIGTTTPQTAFAVAAGNVGIGTWTATGALDVRGGNVRIGAGTNTNATGAGDLYVGGNLEVDGSVWLGDAAADNLTVVGAFNQTGNINTTANVGVGTTTPQASIAVASGNVGIGTWTAAQALDVNGNIIATGTITATGNLSGANMTGSANPSASIGLAAANGTATTFMRSDATPALSQAIAPTWTGIHTFSNATNSALFTGGNVGIGTTTPQGKLVVSDGNIGIGTWVPIVGLQVGAGSGVSSVSAKTDAYIQGNLEVDGSVWLGDAAADNLTIIGSFNQTGNVTTSANLGVGTTTPQTTLAVLGNIGIGTWTAGSQFVVGNNALTINNAGAITASTGMANSGSYTQSGTSANTFTGTSTFSNATTSALFTGGNVGVGTTTPQGAFVVPGGNVGIGTWAPAGVLDIPGYLKVSTTAVEVNLQ